MFKRLQMTRDKVRNAKVVNMETIHPDKNLALEKPVPRIIRVVPLIRVHQHGPLVARDGHDAACKLSPQPDTSHQ
jgi:hypothetical protein